MAESNYINAINNYRDALRAALEIADDPFKAPELTVYTGNDVTRAAWAMAVEYAAMMRGKGTSLADETLSEIRGLMTSDAPHVHKRVGDAVRNYFSKVESDDVH